MPCPCCLGALKPPDLGPVRLGDWYCERCDLLVAAEILEDDRPGAEDGLRCPVHGDIATELA